MRLRNTLPKLFVATAAALLASGAAIAAPTSTIGAAQPGTASLVTPAVGGATSERSASKYLHLVRKGRRGVRVGRRGARLGRRGLSHRYSGYRRHRQLRGHYYRRRHYGGAVAGIAGLIIGGAIIASQRNYRSRWERCDARYRTFRWSDGTYIPYAGGHRVLCPYLRR